MQKCWQKGGRERKRREEGEEEDREEGEEEESEQGEEEQQRRPRRACHADARAGERASRAAEIYSNLI